MDAPRACPLPRWPKIVAALESRGQKVHHLARALGERPALVFAWVYGREDMPAEARRAAEKHLGLEPGSLSG